MAFECINHRNEAVINIRASIIRVIQKFSIMSEHKRSSFQHVKRPETNVYSYFSLPSEIQNFFHVRYRICSRSDNRRISATKLRRYCPVCMQPPSHSVPTMIMHLNKNISKRRGICRCWGTNIVGKVDPG